jgi:hypothetical protein
MNDDFKLECPFCPEICCVTEFQNHFIECKEHNHPELIGFCPKPGNEIKEFEKCKYCNRHEKNLTKHFDMCWVKNDKEKQLPCYLCYKTMHEIDYEDHILTCQEIDKMLVKCEYCFDEMSKNYNHRCKNKFN